MKIRVNEKTHSVDSPASKAALLERLAKEAQDQAAIALNFAGKSKRKK